MYDIRTNVLLTQTQHQVLSTLAKRERKTVGHLIRKAVDTQYVDCKTSPRTKNILQQIDEVRGKGLGLSAEQILSMIREGRK